MTSHIFEGADYAGTLYDYRIRSTGPGGGISAPALTSGSGIALQSVSFGGTGFLTVRRDSGNAYGAVQWKDADMDGEIDLPAGVVEYSNQTIDGPDEWRYPLSYLRSMTSGQSYITATPDLVCPGPAGQLHYLGTGLGVGQDFEETGVGATLRQTMALSTTIENDFLAVTWKVSTDGGISYFDVGTSLNHLYVAGNIAAANNEYETVLDIGCAAAAGNAPDDAAGKAAIRDRIWDKFTSLTVDRVNGRRLVYVANAAQTAAAMIADADGRGQCNAWTDFLSRTLGAQGVASTRYGIRPKDERLFPLFRCFNNAVQGGTAAPVEGFQYHEVLVIEGDDAVYDPTYGLRTPPMPERGWTTAFKAWEEFRVGWIWSNTSDDWLDNVWGTDDLDITPV